MSVTAEQIRSARKADLFEFLSKVHPDDVKREGHWIRMKSNPSICMKEGLGGYKDYSTLESGNSIDFLVRHMNYDFVTAVSCLTKNKGISHAGKPSCHSIILPEKADNTDAIRSYLTSRGFTVEILNRLMGSNLLYQDVRGNAVFCSTDGDFFEARGTRPGKPFHQCGKASPDCFWAFAPSRHLVRAYICESAIDAVSLYLLNLFSAKEEGNASLYCGIAGVANQKAIERIQSRLPAVLAVDNDAAGQQCRLRNRHLPNLVPINKDWNEDLIVAMHTQCVKRVYDR